MNENHLRRLAQHGILLCLRARAAHPREHAGIQAIASWREYGVTVSCIGVSAHNTAHGVWTDVVEAITETEKTTDYTAMVNAGATPEEGLLRVAEGRHGRSEWLRVATAALVAKWSAA